MIEEATAGQRENPPLTYDPSTKTIDPGPLTGVELLEGRVRGGGAGGLEHPPELLVALLDELHLAAELPGGGCGGVWASLGWVGCGCVVTRMGHRHPSSSSGTPACPSHPPTESINGQTPQAKPLTPWQCSTGPVVPPWSSAPLVGLARSPFERLCACAWGWVDRVMGVMSEPMMMIDAFDPTRPTRCRHRSTPRLDRSSVWITPHPPC